MKNIKFILIFGIILILISPIIFTQISSFIDFTKAETNNIGGTIGGITAPFASLLGSILVYYALKTQIDANALIQEQLKEQKETEFESKVITYLKQQLEIIRNDIERFHYIEKTKKNVGNEKIDIEIVKTGSDAIYKYLKIYVVVKSHHNSEDLESDVYQLKQLKNLIFFIDDFIKSVISENIPEKDKTLLTANIKYLYESKIKLHFDYLEEHKSSNLQKCELCGNYHQGIPDEIYEIIYSINNNLISTT